MKISPTCCLNQFMTDFLGCAVQQYLLFVLFPLHVLVFPGMLCTPDDRMIFSYEGRCLEREESASKVGLGTSGSLWLAVSLKDYLGNAAHNNVSPSRSPTNLTFDFQQSAQLFPNFYTKLWILIQLIFCVFITCLLQCSAFLLHPTNCSWFLNA